MGGMALDLERRRSEVRSEVGDFNFEQLANTISSSFQFEAKQTVNHDSTFYITLTIQPSLTRTLAINIRDVLEIFWKNGLDTICGNCANKFNDLDPPVRTLSLVETCPLVIRVHNRHLACLQANQVPFIPVSHVWHESIASANMSHRSNPAAIEHIYYVLSRLLPTVTATFRGRLSSVEIWHDYVSIPQWQRTVQQTALLMLPEIFRTAPFSIIHLDDVSSQMVAASVFEETDTESQDELTRLKHSYRQKYAEWAKFFRARWFQRMWVSLEYAYSRQACLYTQDDVILLNSLEGEFNSFSHLFEGLQQELRRCIERLGLNSFNEMYKSLPVPLLGSLAGMRLNVQNNKTQLSFGEALSFVAGRKSLLYRDRFLAMSGFLNIGRYAEIVPQIPQKPWDACLWLARTCIQRGDYSPFLMLRQKEYVVPWARWLVGHQMMSYHMWDLGATISPAHCGKATIQNNGISLQLSLVGIVKELIVIPFKFFNCPDRIRNFDRIVEIILTHYGKVDITGFLNTLERVYPLPTFLRPSTMPKILSAEFSAPGKAGSGLEILLQQHFILEQPRRLKISDEIAELLHFNKNLEGAAGEFTRLSYGSDLSAKASRYSDALCKVHCPLCTQSFIYRVQVLEGAEGFMRLYRIPGLEYASSMPDGVGLLISNKEIVGRMISGVPACTCKDMKRIEIR